MVLLIQAALKPTNRFQTLTKEGSLPNSRYIYCSAYALDLAINERHAT